MPLPEQEAAAVGPWPPPVLPQSKPVYNVTSSPPPQLLQLYQLEMVAGKAPPLAKFLCDMKTLEGWILQMDGYHTTTQTQNK